ncbi:PepSY-associated TM helix domain-containing protein [Sphingomonas aracearum]|uniref:PepSY domain-containing protein n=1 Tax=Sphingomonas aracearum TaxID=2283317 RepID=A0A369VTC0_9SPHN|nr:PepSY-associated TM helix domain-containing protein [Sphingomonas aracearum]RDE05628.1 PepSY domain-containing protein [Sphingomonas aracearum]
MSKGFRQSQSTLHTWSGLLLGWVLFLVFLTGTLAFWREGLNRYMRPELPPVTQPMRVLAGAQRFLQAKAPDGKSWFVTLPSERLPGAQVFWVPQPKAGEAPRGRRGGGGRRGRDTQALIGADGQPVHARETRGGEFFYRFHFDLHYMPVIWARWLVGVAAAMMLVAILTGIVTHKKIFRDFFTLRRGKGQRSWLDGHNATAVLALPFHLMITYTGLVTLMALLMPWAAVANYVDPAKANEALFPHVEAPARSGRPAPLADLSRIVADAERRLGGPAGYLEVSEAGDAAARVTVLRAPTTLLNTRAPSITYDGVSGRPVWRSPAPGGAAATAGVMIGLHAGRFADVALRWIYFLCGVAGTLMVASGLVLWTVKRREKLPDPVRPPLGFRIVERLNVATIAGFPLGVAAMFWANRLLPAAMPGRAELEVNLLFLAWAAAALLALLCRPAWTWRALFAATGVLLIALPVFNLVGPGRGTFGPLLAGDLVPVGVDATMVAFGAGLLAVARRIARHRPAERNRTRRAPATPSVRVLEPAE